MPQYPLHWDSTGFYAVAEDHPPPVVREFTFDSLYPNPFNASSTLRFSLSREAAVSLRIYDITGRTVEVLMDRPLSAGSHAVTWAPHVATGLYFARLEVVGLSRIQKLVLLR